MAILLFLLFIRLFSDPLPDHIQFSHEDEPLTIRSIDYCNERFFIVDQYSKSIKSFTRDAEFIREYKRLGDGPGDFNSQSGPSRISCLKSGNIVVTDARDRLIFFDQDFNHIETALVQRGQTVINMLVQDMIHETDSHFYFTAWLTLREDPEYNSVILINKETYAIDDIIGAPVFTTHRWLGRHSSVYDQHSEYFVSFSRLTGLIRPFKYESDTYYSFNIQDEISFDFFEQNLPEIPRRLTDFEATGLMTEGRVINSLVSYRGRIYLVQNRFADDPRAFIQVYDYQGRQVETIPNEHDIYGLFVIDGAIYGYNQDVDELYLIKRS